MPICPRMFWLARVTAKRRIRSPPQSVRATTISEPTLNATTAITIPTTIAVTRPVVFAIFLQSRLESRFVA